VGIALISLSGREDFPRDGVTKKIFLPQSEKSRKGGVK